MPLLSKKLMLDDKELTKCQVKSDMINGLPEAISATGLKLQMILENLLKILEKHLKKPLRLKENLKLIMLLIKSKERLKKLQILLL
jgi:hypothetical protein